VEIKPRIVNLGETYRKIGKKRVHCWTGVSMKPDRARAGCARCAGYITCASSRNKNIVVREEVRNPALSAHPAREGEKKPENGLFSPPSEPSAKPSLNTHERTPSIDAEEHTASVVSKLISAVKTQGHVIPEWPVLFLERHQIPHDEAVNVVEGLRLMRKLVQRGDDSWEVPS